MNFLQLVQDLWRESGSGGTSPSDLGANLEGEQLRLKQWIVKADNEINAKYSDWNYLWTQGELQLTVGVRIYDPLGSGGGQASPNSGVAAYDMATFFIGQDAVQAAYYIDVKTDKTEYEPGQPFRAVFMPDDTLRMDGTPDGDYTLTFDYWQNPPILTENADEPRIPARFHQVIVGRALQFYAEFENADETMTKGTDLYDAWIVKLESDQLPGRRDAHTRAEGSTDMAMYTDEEFLFDRERGYRG